jgi:hypothetical protein
MRKILVGLVLIPFFVNRATPDDYDWDLDGDGDTTSERIAASHANHSVFGAAVGEILSNHPAFQSFVTPAIRALVRRRLTSNAALVTESSNLSDAKKLEAKIALLLVDEVNPFQRLYPAERALVEDVHVDTLVNGEKCRESLPMFNDTEIDTVKLVKTSQPVSTAVPTSDNFFKTR